MTPPALSELLCGNSKGVLRALQACLEVDALAALVAASPRLVECFSLWGSLHVELGRDLLAAGLIPNLPPQPLVLKTPGQEALILSLLLRFFARVLRCRELDQCVPTSETRRALATRLLSQPIVGGGSSGLQHLISRPDPEALLQRAVAELFAAVVLFEERKRVLLSAPQWAWNFRCAAFLLSAGAAASRGTIASALRSGQSLRLHSVLGHSPPPVLRRQIEARRFFIEDCLAPLCEASPTDAKRLVDSNELLQPLVQRLYVDFPQTSRSVLRLLLAVLINEEEQEEGKSGLFLRSRHIADLTLLSGALGAEIEVEGLTPARAALRDDLLRLFQHCLGQCSRSFDWQQRAAVKAAASLQGHHLAQQRFVLLQALRAAPLATVSPILRALTTEMRKVPSIARPSASFLWFRCALLVRDALDLLGERAAGFTAEMKAYVPQKVAEDDGAKRQGVWLAWEDQQRERLLAALSLGGSPFLSRANLNAGLASDSPLVRMVTLDLIRGLSVCWLQLKESLLAADLPAMVDTVQCLLVAALPDFHTLLRVLDAPAAAAADGSKEQVPFAAETSSAPLDVIGADGAKIEADDDEEAFDEELDLPGLEVPAPKDEKAEEDSGGVALRERTFSAEQLWADEWRGSTLDEFVVWCRSCTAYFRVFGTANATVRNVWPKIEKFLQERGGRSGAPHGEDGVAKIAALEVFDAVWGFGVFAEDSLSTDLSSSAASRPPINPRSLPAALQLLGHSVKLLRSTPTTASRVRRAIVALLLSMGVMECAILKVSSAVIWAHSLESAREESVEYFLKVLSNVMANLHAFARATVNLETGKYSAFEPAETESSCTLEQICEDVDLSTQFRTPICLTGLLLHSLSYVLPPVSSRAIDVKGLKVRETDLQEVVLMHLAHMCKQDKESFFDFLRKYTWNDDAARLCILEECKGNKRRRELLLAYQEANFFSATSTLLETIDEKHKSADEGEQNEGDEDKLSPPEAGDRDDVLKLWSLILAPHNLTRSSELRSDEDLLKKFSTLEQLQKLEQALSLSTLQADLLTSTERGLIYAFLAKFTNAVDRRISSFTSNNWQWPSVAYPIALKWQPLLRSWEGNRAAWGRVKVRHTAQIASDIMSSDWLNEAVMQIQTTAASTGGDTENLTRIANLLAVLKKTQSVQSEGLAEGVAVDEGEDHYFDDSSNSAIFSNFLPRPWFETLIEKYSACPSQAALRQILFNETLMNSQPPHKWAQLLPDFIDREDGSPSDWLELHSDRLNITLDSSQTKESDNDANQPSLVPFPEVKSQTPSSSPLSSYDLSYVIPYLYGRLRAAYLIHDERRRCRQNRPAGPLRVLLPFEESLPEQAVGTTPLYDAEDGHYDYSKQFFGGKSLTAEELELSRQLTLWMGKNSDAAGTWLGRVVRGGALQLLLLGLANESPVLRTCSIEALACFQAALEDAKNDAVKVAQHRRLMRCRKYCTHLLRSRQKRRRAVPREEVDLEVEKRLPEFALRYEWPFEGLPSILHLLSFAAPSVERGEKEQAVDEEEALEVEAAGPTDGPTDGAYRISAGVAAFLTTAVPVLLDPNDSNARRVLRYLKENGSSPSAATAAEVPLSRSVYNTAAKRDFAVRLCLRGKRPRLLLSLLAAPGLNSKTASRCAKQLLSETVMRDLEDSIAEAQRLHAKKPDAPLHPPQFRRAALLLRELLCWFEEQRYRSKFAFDDRELRTCVCRVFERAKWLRVERLERLRARWNCA